MSKQNKKRPFISIWFGNFFEPFYSGFEATRKGIADCVALGFNSINLDSKAWGDFFDRYRGGKASQYMNARYTHLQVATLKNAVTTLPLFGTKLASQ
jgi:hypothetical protein